MSPFGFCGGVAVDRGAADAEARALLAEGSARLGVPLDPVQVARLTAYLSALRLWNEKINLTGMRDLRGMVARLFLDSLAPLLFLTPGAERWIDIGTGAGFPGLVLKIAAPSLAVTLVEPKRKKAAFLHHIIGRLGLGGVSVCNARIEALGDPHAQRHDVVVTRAVAPEVVLKWGPGLLKPGGKLLFFQSAAEWSAWEARLAAYPDMELSAVWPVKIPFHAVSRSLILVRKADAGRKR